MLLVWMETYEILRFGSFICICPLLLWFLCLFFFMLSFHKHFCGMPHMYSTPFVIQSESLLLLVCPISNFFCFLKLFYLSVSGILFCCVCVSCWLLKKFVAVIFKFYIIIYFSISYVYLFLTKFYYHPLYIYLKRLLCSKILTYFK